jgi:hypothetical protein
MMGGEATRHDGPVVDGHSAGESGPGGVDGHVGAPGLGGGRSSAGDDGARMTGLLQAVQDDYGPRISALESLVARLESRLARLERGGDERGGQAAPPATFLHDEYRGVARRMEALLGQYVSHLAASAGPARAARGRAADGQARLAGELARVLFIGPTPPTGRLDAVLGLLGPVSDDTSLLAERTVKDVTDLCREAGRLGLDHEWFFETSGGPPDTATQVAYGTCDPDQAVAFAVFPGLLVEGRVFLRQQVYTEGLG